MTVNSNTGVPPQSDGTQDLASGLATAQLLQQADDGQAGAGAALTSDAPQEEAHEDDAIANYMAELLNRHNPNAAATAAVVAPPEPQSAPAKQAPSVPETPATRRAPVAPPECRDDLAVMRELANSNAKNALDTYSSSRLVGTIRSRLYIAAGTAVFSIVLAMLSTRVMSIAFLGAVVAFTIAVLWTSRYLVLVRHVSSIIQRPSAPAVSSAPTAAGEVAESPAAPAV